MNEKGYYVLNNFLKKFPKDFINYIVISKDKNIENDYYNEIIDLCNKHKINFFTKSEKIPRFNGYKFAIGWRWIIKDNKNLIILHDSILPKYRGFCPLVNMLINNEKKIGVTALFAANDYDKGEIIKNKSININYPIKISEAIKKIIPLYSSLINEITEIIIKNKNITSRAQDENQASYSIWRDNEDYFINWNKDSNLIKRTIDALGYPYLGAKSYFNDKIIIIEEAEVYPDLKIENREAGKVILIINNYPIIICGQGLLKIKKAKYINNQSIFPLKKFRNRFT